MLRGGIVDVTALQDACILAVPKMSWGSQWQDLPHQAWSLNCGQHK